MGIWLGIFKGFPVLLFFFSAHSIFLVAKWEEMWGGGRGVENGGKLAKRKLMVYFLPSKGGTGKRWAPARNHQLRQCVLQAGLQGKLTGQEGPLRETETGISHFCL